MASETYRVDGVTTQSVLDVIASFPGAFSTVDIARAMPEPCAEYAVRAAISWLVQRGLVRKINTPSAPRVTATPHRASYRVALYRYAPPDTPDFDTLERVFCRYCGSPVPHEAEEAGNG